MARNIDQDNRPGVGAKGIGLETRIAVSALATTVVVLALACGLFIFEQWGAERADIKRALGGLNQMLAADLAADLNRGDLTAVQSELNGLSGIPAVREARVLSVDGAVVARMRPGPAQDNPSQAIVMKTDLVRDGRRVGSLVLAARPPAFIRYLPRYLAVCGALFFAAVAIALLLGRLLARRVVHPVNRLSKAMLEVTHSGDYSQRIPDWARDEFGLLTDSFNRLLAQLQANDQALHRAMIDLVEARDAAQATNVLKSQFLANMSHEIRTPLNGVLAMSEIMAMGDLAPDQRNRLEVIRGSGEALLVVLNDILDLSRIEGGMMSLNEAPFEPPALAADLEATFRPIAADKQQVNLHITSAPGASGPRLGDKARIAQVLGNLVSNALKFTHRGEVHVLLDGYGPQGRDGLKLTVRDTGVGISEKTLPLLFQKFSQADGSNTRRYGGAGLGLAICRELVRMMNGRIEVASVLDQGSTFTVTLPLPVIDPAAPSVVGRERDRPLRVLAAEDIPTNRLVLSTILQSFGVSPHMVDDGLAAVQAWREGEYDLILMDIQMPVLDGLGATAAIRAEEAREHRRRIPIIAVSANAMPHHGRAYLDAGMDAHVAKPIELDKLHAAMRAVLGDRAEAALLAERD